MNIPDVNQEIEVPEQYKKNRIMAVDDEEFCLTTVSALLQQFGISNQ